MRQIDRQIRLVAARRATVLISGETGTGKELAARSIHALGARHRFSLVAVNCAALPEALLEAELFGHVKGAFTRAVNHRIGRFEEAHRGTILLDEIGDLPFGLQAKLLRVLQEREFQRLGSSETIRVDARVNAASHSDLAAAWPRTTGRATSFPGDFPLPPRRPPVASAPGAHPLIAVPDQGLDFERTVGNIELNIRKHALRKTRGNKKLAAEMLGLKRTTLTAKLKSLVAVGAAG
jgi:transcriptional regulator with GAF, ATPase, and Fis domain